MKKSLLILSLFTLLFSLSACGDDNSATNTNTGKPVDPRCLDNTSILYDVDNSTFEIFNAAGLNTFRDNVTVDGNVDVNAKLACDITLDNKADNISWVPIGNIANSYGGTFDGMGHTVSGVYLVDKDDFGSHGLFGNIGRDGIVKNVGVINAEIDGGAWVGAIVGYNNGIVSQSYAKDSIITGLTTVGGIVGQNFGVVTLSYIDNATVTSHDLSEQSMPAVGGIVGDNQNSISSSYVINSHVVAISGITQGRIRQSHVGGILGWNNGGQVEATYVKDTEVESRTYLTSLGGVIGFNASGSVIASFTDNVTLLNRAPTAFIGGIAGESIGTSYVSANYVDDILLGSSIVASPVVVGGIVGNKDVFSTIQGNAFISSDANLYGDGNGGSNIGAERLESVDFTTINNVLKPYTHEFSLDGNKISLILKDTVTINGVTIDNSTWIISNSDGLHNFRDYANLGFINTNAELSSNILLDSNEEWTPIRSYKGTFDGKGNAISGVTINTSATTQGLFGILQSGGVIKNLGVKDVDITASNNIGAIAGMADGEIIASYIDNVTIAGTANSAYIGGVVGATVSAVTLKGVFANDLTLSSTGSTPVIGGILGNDDWGFSTFYAKANYFVSDDVNLFGIGSEGAENANMAKLSTSDALDSAITAMNTAIENNSDYQYVDTNGTISLELK